MNPESWKGKCWKIHIDVKSDWVVSEPKEPAVTSQGRLGSIITPSLAVIYVEISALISSPFEFFTLPCFH